LDLGKIHANLQNPVFLDLQTLLEVPHIAHLIERKNNAEVTKKAAFLTGSIAHAHLSVQGDATEAAQQMDTKKAHQTAFKDQIKIAFIALQNLAIKT
ncbi:hypothetical protein L0F63_004817, partial [Massospora cicadina]